MTYAVSASAPEFATGFPSMVVAGAPITVIVSRTSAQAREDLFEGVTFSYRIEPEDQGIWGRADTVAWAPLAESSDVRLWDAGEVGAARAQARPYVLPTSAAWSGVLIMVVRSPAAKWPNVAPVLLVTPEEWREMTSTFANVLRNDSARLWTAESPTDGSDVLDVADVMRRAGAEAEAEAAFAGPLIRVNVRSHQESLAVMGGFERRAPQQLLGNTSTLRRDLVSAIATVRRRMEYPGPVRLAFQTLWRGRPDSVQLLVEVSAPREGEVPADDLRDLLSELMREHPIGWQFRARHEEHRIRIFGTVQRFRSRPTATTEVQGGLDLPT